MAFFLCACAVSRQFGEGVIDYTEVVGNDLPAQDRLALFKCSRVLVLTAVREVRRWLVGLQLRHRWW